MVRLVLLVPAILLGACVGRAAAQDERLYAGGFGFVSTQDSHRQGTAPSLPRTGVGGTVLGVGGEFGGLVSPHVGVGLEFTIPARIEAVQETDYTRVFQVANRYRDLTLSAVARVKTNPLGPVRLAAFGGGGLVQESSLARRRDALNSFPTTAPVEFGPYGDEMPTTRWTYGVLFGGELEIAVARRVALVPALRVQWVRRSDDPSEPMWFLGLGSVVYRPSVGVRASF